MTNGEITVSRWSLVHLLIALAWAMVRTDGYDAWHHSAREYVNELRARLTA